MHTLKVPLARAEEVVNRHLEEGRQLLETAGEIDSEGRLQDWLNRRRRWADLTETALATVVDDDLAQEFGYAATPVTVIGSSISEDLHHGREAVDRSTNTLVSILERFEYMEPAESPGQAESEVPTSLAGASVFVVHGRNEEVKTSVVRFLERTGEHPVKVLHEQANEGKTLIEKFEEHAAEVGYAVVLLTGDDRGGQTSEDMKPRARQNVVFELGFFFGAIRRRHVAVLYEEGVERPSDIDGVMYIPLDSANEWQRALTRELRAVGLTFSLDKLP